MKLTTIFSMFAVIPGLLLPVAHASDGSDMFVIRQTAKSPDAVVKAIEAYAGKNKWVYLGADKVKKGSVILVKLCIPKVGKMVWPQGMHLSAMLPCGNIGIYSNNDKTEVSMLSARYMHALVPTDAMAKTVEVLTPLLNGFIEEVTR